MSIFLIDLCEDTSVCLGIGSPSYVTIYHLHHLQIKHLENRLTYKKNRNHQT